MDRRGKSVKLVKNLSRVIAQGHPWVYRNALARFDAEPGQVLSIRNKQGKFLARGVADQGPIGVRVLTTRDEEISFELFASRIEAAAELRKKVVPPQTTTYRLLHGEGDRLPGVVCDLYSEYAVMKFDGQGIQHFQSEIIAALTPHLKAQGVRHLLIRSGRGKKHAIQVAFGSIPEHPIEVMERGMKLLVNLVHGQKTGLFIDHRDSRWRLRSLSENLRVLNLYGYTGAFSVAAGLGKAACVSTVDIAKPAIKLADSNWLLNWLPEKRHSSYAIDVKHYLDRAQKKKERFDLVISDPPSFAPAQSNVPGALTAYRALHAAVLSLILPGGLYLAASCSSHIRENEFKQTLLQGARRASRHLNIEQVWTAAPDHPCLNVFPEGQYLKVFLARVR
jgi:23S rRNA (cytosine1962-C5)-methyltransferase